MPRPIRYAATMLRVLYGCEESGVGRRAWALRGHTAFSNDILEARDQSPFHLQMDVFRAIENYGPWDIIILHPDCTKMCVAGNRWYADTEERWDAIFWTKRLWETAKDNARVGAALENPASVLWTYMDDPIQYVQPWQFGHPEQKKTGLALFNLPPLVETDNVLPRMMALSRQERERVFRMAPSPTRSRDRSESYSGIMSAMADQWGDFRG